MMGRRGMRTSTRQLFASTIVGAEYLDAKGSFLVDIDELIDTFYAQRKPLIITTNCTQRQFAERYGERITDRMTECAQWASVVGKSLRQ